MQLTIIILAIIGILLSIYAYYIERKTRKNKHYHAVCDFNNTVSCTKAFSSKYGHTFGVSNSIGGIFFYFLILILVILSIYNIYNLSSIIINSIFYLTIISMIGSTYLAYASYFKLKNFCMICNAIYIINILLVVFSYFWIW